MLAEPVESTRETFGTQKGSTIPRPCQRKKGPAKAPLVPKEGVEPSWIAPRDFESRASAIPPLRHDVTAVQTVGRLCPLQSETSIKKGGESHGELRRLARFDEACA